MTPSSSTTVSPTLSHTTSTPTTSRPRAKKVDPCLQDLKQSENKFFQQLQPQDSDGQGYATRQKKLFKKD